LLNVYITPYTVFVINLRLRKRQSGELATDFTEPVVVSLQPDIHEIKAAMANCVQKIVDASRGFPHPEQNMGQIFGGKPFFSVLLLFDVHIAFVCRDIFIKVAFWCHLLILSTQHNNVQARTTEWCRL
jgi:hypothetical protein